MQIVSTREFRGSQTKYLNLASSGEQVIIKSRSAGCFELKPISHVKEDLTPAERKFRMAMRELRAALDGKIELTSAEDLLDELRNSGPAAR